MDRNNLGRQTWDEFANFDPPDDSRKFPELYTVQRLAANAVNPAAKIARMGNKALRAVLVECAHAAARTHGCQFRGYHRAPMVRHGYKRAIVATAYKLLRVLYVVLRDARPYHDPEADYEALMVRRNAPRWIRMLHRYGLIEYGPAAAA